MSSPQITSHSPVIQPRDLDILRTLLDAKVAFSRQIAAIHFSGKHEATKKRLQTLRRSGFIAARARRPQEPAVLFLTRIGLRLLKDRGLLPDSSQGLPASLERIPRTRDSTVRRELEVLDVRIALQEALAGLPFTLTCFTTSQHLQASSSGRPRNGLRIRPDAFIAFNHTTPGSHSSSILLYLQPDRPAESLESLVARAQAYRTHFQSGDFARFLGESPERYRDFPFRVLFVFKTRERQDAFAQCLLSLSPPILTQAWLTTFAELVADPVGAIWLCPIDYRPRSNGASGRRTSRERRPLLSPL